jgi:hypothetical protein
MVQEKTTKQQTDRIYFQEVEVVRRQTVVEGVLKITFDKVRVTREKVKISQAEADALNNGRKDHPDNKYFAMYLKPGEEVEPIIIKRN